MKKSKPVRVYHPQVERAIQVVERSSGHPRKQIFSEDRSKSIVAARSTITALAQYATGMSAVELGRELGCDHSTVGSRIGRVAGWLADPLFKSVWDGLCKEVSA